MIEMAVGVHQNKFLPPGATEVDALLTITAGPGGPAVPETTGFAEVIIIDCSSSMNWPREQKKISEARRAAAAAIDGLRAGAHFAVIAGTASARPVYPAAGMAVASEESRREAKEAIAQLRADGGTAMGSWLRMAKRLLRMQPTAIRHVIMLTDGKNESESPARFTAALDACEGHFQCDCRGIGEGWVAAELNVIASKLLGTALDVATPADLIDDFRAMIRSAMNKIADDVSLRVWVPRGAEVRALKQTAPVIEDLTGRAVRVDDTTVEYPTGAWGREKRDFYLGIGGLSPIVSFGAANSPSRAGRVSLVVDGAECTSASVLAQWTDDHDLFTEVNTHVAEGAGQLDLALAIQRGAAALRAGDTQTAVAELGEAARLAYENGNQAKLDLLAKLAELVDPAAGKIRLRADLSEHDIEVSDLRSRWTIAIERSEEKEHSS